MLILPENVQPVENHQSSNNQNKKLDGKVVAAMGVSLGIIACGVMLCVVAEIRRRLNEGRNKSIVHLPLIID